jgi:putative ABC transport system permease protein
MFKDYLRTALRNIGCSKFFTLINLLGLVVGIAACLLILLYVTFEFSYDRQQPAADRLYRIRYDRESTNGTAVRFASCCPPASALIAERIPEVERIGRVFRYRATVLHDNLKYKELQMYFAEPAILELLKVDFITGDPATVLANVNSAVISRATARKYFGDQDPLGQTFSVDKRQDFIVTGVFEDLPRNTHLKFDVLLAFPAICQIYNDDVLTAWGHTGFYTYARVQPRTSPLALKDKLRQMVHAEVGELMQAYDLEIILDPQRVTDIHLTSHYMQEYEANGDRTAVILLLAVAIFILLIAWVNYINLSTARSLRRAREVGLRKVVGANRRQLLNQFFLEILIMNGIAVFLALGSVELLMPAFRKLTGLPETYVLWQQPWFFLGLLGMLIGGTLLVGIYPVLVQTSFQPIVVLRSQFGKGQKGAGFRRVLVVFQYVITLFLFVATLTVYRQLNHLRQQNLGFNMDQIFAVEVPRIQDEKYEENYAAFKEELLRYPSIQGLSFSSEVPGRQILWDAGGIKPAGTDDSEFKNYQILGIDYDFLKLYDMQLLAGRNFDKEFSTDNRALVLNETAARWMGWSTPEVALHQQVDYWGEIFDVVGVVADHHQQSPKAAYEPTLLRLLPRSQRGYFSVKMAAADISGTIKQVRRSFETFFPDNPFVYFFIDEYFNEQYKADERFGEVFRLFSGLALFITCLGVFGLTAYNTVQRRREIGIRKVLGAEVSRIVLLLLNELLLLMAVAALLTLPLSWWAVRRWLATFASRMELRLDLFLLPLLAVLVISCLTILSQTVKAALTNPVDVIRYE